MLPRMGALSVLLGCLLGCAPLPPTIPQDPVIPPPVTQDSLIPPRYDTVATVPASPEKVLQKHTLPPIPDEIPPAASSSRQILTKPFPLALHRPIRVGLSFEKNRHTLQGQGSCTVLLDGNRSMRLTPPFTVILKNNHLVLQNSQNPSLATASRLEIIPWNPEQPLRLNGKGYRGQLEFTPQAQTIHVVNVISVEDYLKGVVPHEMGRLDLNGLEALKTQAVAARTYAYRHFNSRASLGFDIYADVRDQVYEGLDGEYELANQAILSTRGVVMEYQGEMIDAYYHSTCGGHTESVETWGRSALPYLTPVSDLDPQGKPWCAESQLLHWEVRFTDKELVATVQKNAIQAKADRIFPFSSIDKIFILNRLPGGRVGELLISTDQGTLLVKGDRTRWLLKQGSKILPSAHFELERGSGEWIVSGKGFGHGIGMCQMGARGRSRAGQSYREILWHYYPSIDLVQYQD